MDYFGLNLCTHCIVSCFIICFVFWNKFYWYFSVLNKICFVINILFPRCFGDKMPHRLLSSILLNWMIDTALPKLVAYSYGFVQSHVYIFYDLLLHYCKLNCTHLPPTVLFKTTFSHEIKLCLEVIYKMLL